MASHERHVVSNDWSFDCLFNSLYGPTSKKHQSLHYWPFVRGFHQCRWTQRPVTRKKASIRWRHHDLRSNLTLWRKTLTDHVDFDAICNEAYFINITVFVLFLPRGHGYVIHSESLMTSYTTLQILGYGPISRTSFPSWFKLDGKLLLAWLHCRLSYRFKILHMPRQYSMCKI